MHIKDHSAAMKFFRTYDNVASKGKWKEFVDEMEFESMLQEPRTMAQEPRNMYAGGQLVQNTADGSRPGYSGSLLELGKGYNVSFGQRGKDNYISQFFGPKEHGSSAEAKKAAKTFLKETQQTWTSQGGKREGKGTYRALTSVFEDLVKEGVDEFTFQDVKSKLPKNVLKKTTDYNLRSQISLFKNRYYPDMKYKKTYPKFLKAPGEVAKVTELIEQGLPMKELKAEGFSERFILNVAKNSNLKIAKTTRDYYDNVKKITKDITTLGKNKDILNAFKKGELTNKLIEKTGSIIKSKDSFYNSRILFKLAEYYDGSLEGHYKVDLPKPTDSQITNSKKVIKTSSKLMGGKKRTGYAFDASLYHWGGKQIDKALNLPLGSFYKIQQEIIKELPSGISLDEVFGVKSSGRYAPVEGVLVNPLDVKTNVSKGVLVDTIKSAYHKDLIQNVGNPEAQKEILKNYRNTVNKTKKKYPGVEFPDYEIGKPPNKTIKGFDKLGPQIKKHLLANYKETGISPKSTKAMSIFDIAQATGSKTFAALDKKTKSSLLGNLEINLKALCPKGKGKASGGRIGFAEGPATVTCGKERLNQIIKSGNIEGLPGEEQKLVRQILNQGKGFLKGTGRFALGMLNPKQFFNLRTLLGPEAAAFFAVWEGGVITNDVLRHNLPLGEAVAKNWMTGWAKKNTLLEEQLGNMRKNNFITTPGSERAAQSIGLMEDVNRAYSELDKIKMITYMNPFASDKEAVREAMTNKEAEIKELEKKYLDFKSSKEGMDEEQFEKDLNEYEAHQGAGYHVPGEVQKDIFGHYVKGDPEANEPGKIRVNEYGYRNVAPFDAPKLEPRAKKITMPRARSGIELDWSTPDHKTIKETPLNEQDIEAITNWKRKMGELRPEDEMKDMFRTKTKRSMLEEEQIKNKWAQAYYQPGRRGTAFAGGGLANLTRTVAPDSEGILSLKKKW